MRLARAFAFSAIFLIPQIGLADEIEGKTAFPPSYFQCEHSLHSEETIERNRPLPIGAVVTASMCGTLDIRTLLEKGAKGSEKQVRECRKNLRKKLLSEANSETKTALVDALLKGIEAAEAQLKSEKDKQELVRQKKLLQSNALSERVVDDLLAALFSNKLAEMKSKTREELTMSGKMMATASFPKKFKLVELESKEGASRMEYINEQDPKKLLIVEVAGKKYIGWRYGGWGTGKNAEMMDPSHYKQFNKDLSELEFDAYFWAHGEHGQTLEGSDDPKQKRFYQLIVDRNSGNPRVLLVINRKEGLRTKVVEVKEIAIGESKTFEFSSAGKTKESMRKVTLQVKCERRGQGDEPSVVDAPQMTDISSYTPLE